MTKPRKSGGSMVVTIPAEIARVKGWTVDVDLTLAFLATSPTSKVDNETPVIVVETRQRGRRE